MQHELFKMPERFQIAWLQFSRVVTHKPHSASESRSDFVVVVVILLEGFVLAASFMPAMIS